MQHTSQALLQQATLTCYILATSFEDCIANVVLHVGVQTYIQRMENLGRYLHFVLTDFFQLRPSLRSF